MNRPPRREERSPQGGRGGIRGPDGGGRPPGLNRRAGPQDRGGPPARVRPVYREARDLLRPRPPTTANLGLLYDRYADIWSGDAGNWEPQTSRDGGSVRQRFLEEMAQHAQDVAPQLASLLRALHERRAALWRFLDAHEVDVTLATPLVSGTGMTHALEVGFVWDRNLGVPFLPASSLKGATRAWAQHWEGLVGPTLARTFGDRPAETAEAGGAGTVVFHALYPVEPPRVRVDVLNPHFAEYYQGKVRQPGDWLAPQPVFFLTVPAGTRFRTALHTRPDAAPADRAQAERWLHDALSNLGIGAKTAVGYGLFTPSG
ncbi:MAG: type III-B CRISPR module RAMP protein Cmr6 [Chloroflexi bacterium]|nr:type III-B CRISPR module RAMP protein Cmr6 [Chloroflexota bacterium]